MYEVYDIETDEIHLKHSSEDYCHWRATVWNITKGRQIYFVREIVEDEEE